MTSDLDSFTITEKEVYTRLFFSKRDVRSHFIDKKIPNDILVKILNAAHNAPSSWFHAAMGIYFNKEYDHKTKS